jgi:hypothetical protein
MVYTWSVNSIWGSALAPYGIYRPCINHIRSTTNHVTNSIPIKTGEMKFTRHFGYLEHPDISKLFGGPSNYEIEVFYCISLYFAL